MSGADDDQPQGRWAQRLADSAQRVTRDLSERLAANAAELASAAANASEELRRSEAFHQARERARQAAGVAQKKAVEGGLLAKSLMELLAKAPEELDTPPILIERFTALLPSLSGQLDREADAVALGYLRGAGAGVAEVAGTEVLYLRGEGPIRGHLRVSSLAGKVARLSIGASTAAYAACLYGQRAALARPGRRRGADAGVLVASLGFFRVMSTRGDRLASGWMAGLGAGVGLGIPILSDLSAFELADETIGALQLERKDSDEIEDALMDAPDRTWRRKLARKL